MDFETWIYRIIIGALAVILWWGIQRLIKKFDELIISINELTATSKQQQEQIKGIHSITIDQNKRLNDHGTRIRTLELKLAECQACQQNTKTNG